MSEYIVNTNDRDYYFSRGDDIEKQIKLLTAKRQNAVLTTAQLQLAAYLGHQAAMAIVGKQNLPTYPEVDLIQSKSSTILKCGDMASFVVELRRWDQALLRTILGCTAFSKRFFYNQKQSENKLEIPVQTLRSLLYSKETIHTMDVSVEPTYSVRRNWPSSEFVVPYFETEDGYEFSDDVVHSHQRQRPHVDVLVDQLWIIAEVYKQRSAIDLILETLHVVDTVLNIYQFGDRDSNPVVIDSKGVTFPSSPEDKVKQAIIESLLPWALGEYDPLEKYRTTDKSLLASCDVE